LAPVFFACLFGVIELGRLAWTKQALREAAYSAARCHMVNDSACGTTQQQISYAVARAKANGIVIAAANVSIQANVACRGVGQASMVEINKPFSSPISQLVPLPTTVSAKSCLPGLAG